MKRKVAVLLHGLGSNGIDTLYANLAEYWNYDNLEITYFLAVDKEAKQFWEKRVSQTFVRIVHITDLDGRKLYQWPINLYKNLKEYGPFDVIHVNMDMLNGINLIVAKCAGIEKRVCHAHTSGNIEGNTRIKKIYISLMKIFIQIFSADRIACSDVAGNYFFGGGYELLYNGISLESKVKKCDLNIDSPVFITVGRIVSPKRPMFIIELMHEILMRKKNAKLLWIGAGNLEEKVKEEAKKREIFENIDFLGMQDNVNKFLNEADYFLLPSLYEGLSLALAEAQAAGLNCFVSDTVSRLSDCGGCIFLPLEKDAKYWANEFVVI